MRELSSLALFIIDLQRERSAVALSLYISQKSGQKEDLSKLFSQTDRTLTNIEWRAFSEEKIFTTKLRFQIKLDDFR